MTCGDPMWTCPFCNRTYYSNVQMYCDCRPPWLNSYANPFPDYNFTNPDELMKKKKTLSEEFDEMFINPKPVQKTELNDLYEQIIEPKTNPPKKSAKEIEFEEMFGSLFDHQEHKAIVNDVSKHSPRVKSTVADVIDAFAHQDEVDELLLINDKPKKNTLVVNMFAGPGAGKSTTAAGVFFELKSRGVNCEIAAEFAKDLTWEERHNTLTDQIYIFGKQYHRISRLMGKVDVIITDSPILLTPIYDGEKRKSLEQLVVSEHRKMWAYNVFIKRVKPFQQAGRIHGEQVAHDVDRRILSYLDDLGECYETFEGTPKGKDAIVGKIMMLLSLNHAE